MARSAILSVRILGDARSAVSAMRDTEAQSSRLGGVLSTVGSGLAVGAAAITGAAVGLGAALVPAISSAAQLEQSVGAIDAVFGQFSGSMHEMSASAATDVGLTKNQFNELGTLIGTQLKNGGTAMDELAPKTRDLIGTGADLAAMFGGTTADAVGALSSALKGERDPIERYGVSLNQAAIDAKAAELGFEKVGNSLSAEANQAATLAIIMEQTSVAHGTFARESGTLSGQLERMRASWGNVVATVGEFFLPVITSAATVVNTHVMPALQGAADALNEGGLAGAFTYLAGVIPGVSGPLEVVGAGLERAAGLGRAAWETLGGLLAPALSALDGGLAGAAGTVVQFVSAFSPMQVLFAALAPLLPQIGALLGTVAGAVLQLMQAAIPLGVQLGGVLVPVLTQVAAAVLPALMSVVSAVVGILPTLTGLFSQVSDVVVSVISAVAPLVTQLVTGLAPVVVQLVQSVLPPVVGALTAIVPPVLALVGVLVSALVPAVAALLPIVTSVFSGVSSIISGVMQVVSGVIQVVMGVITGNWSSAWEGVKSIFSGTWTAIEGILTTAVGLVSGILTTAAGAVTVLWETLWAGVTTFFSNTWDTIVGTVEDKGGAVLDFLGGIPDTVMGFFSGAGSWLLSAGEDIINGLLTGAGNILPSIGRFFLDKVPAFIREPFKRALGIHSPSRVFAGLGRDTIAGVPVGVQAGAASAIRAVQGVAGRIIDRGQRALSDGLTVPVAAAQVARLPGVSATAPAPSSAGPATITVNITTGVGDPVEIGRELDNVLRRYRQTVGTA